MSDKHRKSQPSRVPRLPSLNCGWGQLNMTQILVTSERLMTSDKSALRENGNSPVQPTVEREIRKALGECRSPTLPPWASRVAVVALGQRGKELVTDDRVY